MGPLENQIRRQVAQYLHQQYPYPKLIWWFDLTGERLPIGLAKKLKNLKSATGICDLFIAEPRGPYKALFIELKCDDPYISRFVDKKNKGTEHLREQQDMIDQLNSRGYYACFGIGFDATINIINAYLNQ